MLALWRRPLRLKGQVFQVLLALNSECVSQCLREGRMYGNNVLWDQIDPASTCLALIRPTCSHPLLPSPLGSHGPTPLPPAWPGWCPSHFQEEGNKHNAHSLDGRKPAASSPEAPGCSGLLSGLGTEAGSSWGFGHRAQGMGKPPARSYGWRGPGGNLEVHAQTPAIPACIPGAYEAISLWF